jgi:hypothetical protein
MAKKSRTTTALSLNEKIALRAYEIYLADNRPGDHALEHWLRAEKELKLQLRGSSARAGREREPAQMIEPVAPTRRVYASPVEAWCSAAEEPEEFEYGRKRPRTAVYA